jgi:hypothetical protein
MFTYRKPATVLLMILMLLWLPALACDLPLPENASPETRQTATAQYKPTAEAIEAYEQELETENRTVMENPDEKLVFSYSGENQSYHTGLRNRTVFYINNDIGKVLADESAPFEEPFGCHTAVGTDTVYFDGIIADGLEIQGDLTITTKFTASGCEDTSATTVSYVMVGTLHADLVNGQWVGVVAGDSTLKQTWEGGELPPETTTKIVEWTITGTSVK